MGTDENKLIIQGGRVIDLGSDTDAKRDILIEGETIEAVDKPGSFSSVEGAEVVDATGLLVCPGLCDVHVHLREPGYEWKETIETGTRALAAGGFTSVCCMPNTKPVNDHAEITEYILDKADEAGFCRVYPIGAITKGSKGEDLAPMRELCEAGCVAFSDDGACVQNALLMRRALEYSLMFDTVLAVHEEEKTLSEGFCMNESALSLKLGLKAMPEAAENVMISRDVELVRLTGGRVHFCHVSTARGVTLVRRAKEDGLPVTAEIMPHNFVLTEDAVGNFDTNAKMSMPLRSAEDVEALVEGLKDGVIDCIASDHAPHELDSKQKEFEAASFGTIGAQSTLPLALERVRQGRWTLKRAIEALTVAPRRCLKLPEAGIAKGMLADITVIDLERCMKLTPETILSKSKNTPFLGFDLQGLAVRTIVGGRTVFDIQEFEIGE